MSEYKRLTAKDSCYYDKMDNVDVDALYCRLAELENKIEGGQLVELPCKVGDTVFVIVPFCHNCKDYKGEHCYCKNRSKKKIVKMTVHSIRYDKNGYVLTEDMANSMGSLSLYCYQKYFGERWFFDNKQAEARLKELKGEGV